MLVSTQAAAISEWTLHRSANGAHPNGTEQAVIWLMNRARANPPSEGEWLASSTNINIAAGRDYIQRPVDLEMLRNEFNDILPTPPAAFDYRPYKSARAHAVDLIRRDAQDHNGQFDRVNSTGIGWSTYRGSVFSYADSALHAHAAFNIDWGAGPGNMQPNRGHRVALMSTDSTYSNVGVAAQNENDTSTEVGKKVIVVNYLSLNTSFTQHFNRFVVGTVWRDLNGNNRYDPNEGIPGVVVMPNKGRYYAVTSAGGGYAFPVGANRTVSVAFSGGGVQPSNASVSVGGVSVQVDYKVDSGGAEAVSFPSNSGKDIVLPLRMSVKNTTRLGWGYGTRYNRSEARYRFEGNSHGVVLKAVGWDIDRAKEVKVLVNGELVGRLEKTPDRRSGKTSQFKLPRRLLRSGNNIIRFVQTRPGEKWGVKNVVVRPL